MNKPKVISTVMAHIRYEDGIEIPAAMSPSGSAVGIDLGDDLTIFLYSSDVAEKLKLAAHQSSQLLREAGR